MMEYPFCGARPAQGRGDRDGVLEEAGLGADEVDAVGGLTMGADPVASGFTIGVYFQ